MGCIPSKQKVLDEFDGYGPTASKGRPSKKTKSPKQPKYKVPKKPGPPSPVVEDDAPPWVTGHRVVAVKRGDNDEVFLTERDRKGW